MKRFIKFYLFLLILLIPVAVFGDTLALPRTYSVNSADNKFIFVMIAPIEIERDGISYGEDGMQEARRIRVKYSKSGMYAANGSTEPLWTVEWYAHSVISASDGVHLIRKGPWASKMSDEAFTVFAGGTEIRSFKISELITTTKDLPRSVSHFIWEKSMSLNDENKTVSVVTLKGEKFIFDYQTGFLFSKNKTDSDLLR